MCSSDLLQIALGADLRLVTADSRLSVMEIKWGLIPDMAISQTLPLAHEPAQRRRCLKALALFNGDESP